MKYFESKTLIEGRYEINYDELAKKLRIPFITHIKPVDNLLSDEPRKLIIVTESVE